MRGSRSYCSSPTSLKVIDLCMPVKHSIKTFTYSWPMRSRYHEANRVVCAETVLNRNLYPGHKPLPSSNPPGSLHMHSPKARMVPLRAVVCLSDPLAQPHHLLLIEQCSALQPSIDPLQCRPPQ
jgi:hypothetical protein